MEGAKQFYKMVSEFNLNVQDLLRRAGNTCTHWTSTEVPVEAAYNNTRFVVSIMVAVIFSVFERVCLYLDIFM